MAVETPESGRATFSDLGTEIQVIIPSKKRVFIILFLCFWMGGWFMGERFAIEALLRPAEGAKSDWFLIFWLAGWTLGGAFALISLLWLLAGREILTVSSGTLKLERRIFGFGRTNEYTLHQVKNLRVVQPEQSWGYNRSMSGYWGLTGGRIGFDYGMKTIRFGAVDEPEADHIINQLKSRHRSLA